LLSIVYAGLRIPYKLLSWAIPRGARDWLVRPYITYSKKKNLDAITEALPYWERQVRFKDLKPVRVGLVGAGSYARYHLEVLSSLPGVEISSILTTGNPRVTDVADRYNIKAIYTDQAQFLDQDEVDCFFVAASAHAVKPVSQACLATGRPVFMEKPPGFSSQETQELIEQARQSNTFGMVGMNRRFYSVLEHGLAALAECGPLRGILLEDHIAITKERNSGKYLPIEYQNFMSRNAIHGLDLLRYVLGDVRKVHSLAQRHADWGYSAASFAGLIEHENGGISTYIGLWDTVRMTRFKVIAENGWIELEPPDLKTCIFVDAQRRTFQIKPDPMDIKFRMGLYSQDSCFINAVRKGRAPALPACLLPDAYSTNALIEEIQSNNVHQDDPIERVS